MIEHIKNVLIALKVLGIEKRIKDLEDRPIAIRGGGSGSGGDLTQETADARYVNVTGDTMTGDLEFGDVGEGIILRVNSGSGPGTGNPIATPPFLWMTYASGAGGTTKRFRVTVSETGNLNTTEL